MFTYTNISFFLFLVAMLVFYHIFSEKYRWIVLFAGNMLFIYLNNDLGMSFLTIFIFLITYVLGVFLEKNQETKRGSDYLTIGVIFILFILLFVKYETIWIGTYNLFSRAVNAPGIQYIDFISPFGISYFVLGFISYLCDVHWGIIKAEKNPFKLLTITLFFPVLTSGPIIKYEQIHSSVMEGKNLSYKNICFGAQRILWGIFKKIVISDRLAVIVDTIYSNYEEYNGFYVPMAVCFFVLQLYTDFSGCIDIMLGIAQLFGIELPENFNKPFCSTTIAEFFRRWHITLGNWLKDYVFYPLLRSDLWNKLGKETKKRFGKKVSKKITTWSGLFITWLLIGVWHGGKLNYIFSSGIFMGVIIILEDAFENLSSKIKNRIRISDNSLWWKLFQQIRTFILFSFGMSFFRSSSIKEGIGLWKAFFSNFNPRIFIDGSIYSLGLTNKNVLVLGISLIIMFSCYGISAAKQKSIRELVAERNIIIRWFLYLALIWIVLVFGNYGPGYDASEFIYERF